MNTTNSSFDPLEYYRQLTHCLANKKNLKLNLSKVPGAREYCNHKKSPIFTEQKLQEKFLSKYNLRRQQEPEEEVKQQKTKQVKNPQSKLNFHLKQNNLMRVNKRKNEKDDYINLPDTFFKGIKLPDISMLRLAKDPDPKRPRLNDDSSIPIQSNFTFSSLFSGNFNPPKNSTPKSNEPEKARISSKPMLKIPTPESKKSLKNSPFERMETPKGFEPLICDPNEILSSKKTEKNTNEKISQISNIKTSFQDEKGNSSTYCDLLDRVAKGIDIKYFTHTSDPFEKIFEKLINKYECATQSPRNSMLQTNVRKVVENPQAVIQSATEKPIAWPVPVFYERPQEDEEKSVFIDDETRRLFEFEPDYDNSAYCDFKFDTPKIEKNLLSPFGRISNHFFSVTNTPNSTRFSFNIPDNPLFGNHENFDEGIDIDGDRDIFQLEKAFETSLKMNWETESNFTVESPNIDLSIFRSPPKIKSQQCLEKRFSRTISRPSKNTTDITNGLDWMNTSTESVSAFNVSQESNFFGNSFNLF